MHHTHPLLHKITRDFKLGERLPTGTTSHENKRETEGLYLTAVVRCLAAVMCFWCLLGVLVLASEIGVFFLELVTLTLMGIIVNAGSLLRYISLLVLLGLYALNTFADVSKTYSKSLKHLFKEIKKRCKDVDDVTSLPEHLQQNYAFKSEELSEQADYEKPDDFFISDTQQTWCINDLVLFIDTQDTPRLPKRLFEEVCQIQTVGSPGPVYLHVLEASKSFLKIATFVTFVFIVVGVFGTLYSVTSTNQMMATMAGGALPLLVRKFFASPRSAAELNTVSFQSKLDEIIKGFDEVWPMIDLHFELWTSDDKNKLSTAGLTERTYYRRLSLSPDVTPRTDCIEHPLSEDATQLVENRLNTPLKDLTPNYNKAIDLLLVNEYTENLS